MSRLEGILRVGACGAAGAIAYLTWVVLNAEQVSSGFLGMPLVLATSVLFGALVGLLHGVLGELAGLLARAIRLGPMLSVTVPVVVVSISAVLFASQGSTAGFFERATWVTLLTAASLVSGLLSRRRTLVSARRDSG